MSNEEKTPRTLEQLIADFNASSGEFAKFHKELGEREKILFKGWLHQMRAMPPSFSADPNIGMVGGLIDRKL